MDKQCFDFAQQPLSIGKYARKTQRVGRLASQPTAVLYLVRQLAEKKSERKRKNLIRLGVEPGQAYAWSRSRT